MISSCLRIHGFPHKISQLCTFLVCTSVHVCMPVHMYVYMYVCMYVSISVHVYACTSVYHKINFQSMKVELSNLLASIVLARDIAAQDLCKAWQSSTSIRSCKQESKVHTVNLTDEIKVHIHFAVYKTCLLRVFLIMPSRLPVLFWKCGYLCQSMYEYVQTIVRTLSVINHWSSCIQPSKANSLLKSSAGCIDQHLHQRLVQESYKSDVVHGLH